MNPYRLLSTKKINPALRKEVAAKGIEVIEKEFIQIVAISTGEKKQEVKRLMEEDAIVAITSKNAVKALVSLVGDFRNSLWKIFCLEGATLQEAKKYFTDKNILGTAASAKNLADKIVEKIDGKHILFFCGDKRRDDLPHILNKNGISVNEVVVYKTEYSPVKVSNEYNGIAFFSPTAVESFFSVNQPAPDVICFSVGATTTAALKKFTTNKIITSEEAGEEKVLEAVGRVTGNSE
jgi:uroporphyrinogen-III synthase